jgi:hypothetical protein
VNRDTIIRWLFDTGWTVRGSTDGGSEIFRTRSDRPWSPQNFLYNGYRVSFPEVKRRGRGVDHPPPSSVEVKERVELYLYSPSGPSSLVPGGNLCVIMSLHSPLKCLREYLILPTCGYDMIPIDNPSDGPPFIRYIP